MFLSEKFNTQFYCCLTGLHLTGGSRAPKVARPMAKFSKSVWTGLASILKPKCQSFNGKFLEKQKNKNSLSLHCFTFFHVFLCNKTFHAEHKRLSWQALTFPCPSGCSSNFSEGWLAQELSVVCFHVLSVLLQLVDRSVEMWVTQASCALQPSIFKHGWMVFMHWHQTIEIDAFSMFNIFFRKEKVKVGLCQLMQRLWQAAAWHRRLQIILKLKLVKEWYQIRYDRTICIRVFPWSHVRFDWFACF